MVEIVEMWGMQSPIHANVLINNYSHPLKVPNAAVITKKANHIQLWVNLKGCYSYLLLGTGTAIFKCLHWKRPCKQMMFFRRYSHGNTEYRAAVFPDVLKELRVDGHVCGGCQKYFWDRPPPCPSYMALRFHADWTLALSQLSACTILHPP